eukprot:400294-Hanusia_phi.AAC.3
MPKCPTGLLLPLRLLPFLSGSSPVASLLIIAAPSASPRLDASPSLAAGSSRLLGATICSTWLLLVCTRRERGEVERKVMPCWR